MGPRELAVATVVLFSVAIVIFLDSGRDDFLVVFELEPAFRSCIESSANLGKSTC